jgi:hypothetical protein
VVERELAGVVLPPRAVKACVVVFRVVGDDYNASSGSGSGTGRPQMLEKLPAGNGVESIRLTPKEELAITQADGTEVTDTASGGMVKQYWVLGFRRNPHPAARTVLLKVHFVHGPKIDGGVKA